MNISEFAEKYVTIKTTYGERKFTPQEIDTIKEYEKLTQQGYELKLIHLRKCSTIKWCKG